MTGRLWWVDVKTTGLDPRRDQILEVALSSSPLNDPFNVTEEYHAVCRLVRAAGRYWSSHGTTIIVDPFVEMMHTKSGLWEECDRSDVLAYSAVNEVVARVQGDPAILAGSSVHFDRGFLESVGGNQIRTVFSHRHYDVSAIKLFCESLGMPKIPKGEAHRAQADVLESVAHAKLCAEWLGKR